MNTHRSAGQISDGPRRKDPLDVSGPGKGKCGGRADTGGGPWPTQQRGAVGCRGEGGG